MKKYPKYKPSSIEWLGDIPDNWDVKRLAFIGQFSKGGGISKAELTESGEPVVIYGDIYTQYDIKTEKFIRYTTKEIASYSIEVHSGDLLFTGSGETVEDIGKTIVYLGKQIAFAGGDVLIFRQDGSANSLFLSYVMNSNEIKFEKSKLAKGQIIVHVYSSQLKNISIPLPPLKEQTQIARYLDSKTNEIDTLIANKQRLIELLQEERTATINHAVTKGINPKVKLKPSGIDWLGDIPEHWEVWKLSHAFNKIGSGTTPESGNSLYHENGTINWLNTGDLNDGYLDSTSKKVTQKALDDYSALKIFPAGSVVIAMYGATIAKTSIVRFETSMNQACCLFYGSSKIQNEFLFYWFKSKKENIINLAKGGGQPNISQDILKSLKVPCPDLKEQAKIISYIREEEDRINTIISKIEQEIDLLNEYKTALISEVVTGKVDVREEVIG